MTLQELMPQNQMSIKILSKNLTLNYVGAETQIGLLILFDLMLL